MARVLIVDDDPVILDLVELNFTLEEHEVLTAASGDAALRAAREERPDAIVLDVMLPEIDGFEVCRQLGADPATAGIPVVLLSARALQPDVDRGLAAGAAAYVTKPFDPLELVARVERLVQRAGEAP